MFFPFLDANMCAGGIPVPNKINAIDAVNAAIEMQQFIIEWKQYNSQNDLTSKVLALVETFDWIYKFLFIIANI